MRAARRRQHEQGHGASGGAAAPGVASFGHGASGGAAAPGVASTGHGASGGAETPRVALARIRAQSCGIAAA